MRILTLVSILLLSLSGKATAQNEEYILDDMRRKVDGLFEDYKSSIPGNLTNDDKVLMKYLTVFTGYDEEDGLHYLGIILPHKFFFGNTFAEELNYIGGKIVADIGRILSVNKVVLGVYSHSCSTGSLSVNEKSTTAQANTIAGSLKSGGLADGVFEKIEGVASNSPLEDNDTALGRAINRRTEIYVLIDN